MKVALIQPEVPQSEDENLLGVYPPMGLAWLAGNTRTHDIEVQDLRISPLVIKEWDVVGVSCQTVAVEECRTVAQKIREENPDTIIVTGGHHSLTEELLDFSDYVVRGEGEVTFSKLLSGLEKHRPVHTILGVSSREGSAPDRPPADLVKLNSPDYDVISVERYHPNEGTLVTSRGCPYHCTFCVRPFGHTWRGRTPSQVVEEARILRERGAEILHIMDDLFTYDRERVFKICKGLASLDVKWDLPNGTRVDTVDEDMLCTMAESGCERILYGIESGVEEVLKKIGKDITLNQIERAVSMTKKAGIEVEGLFMVGNPGDTPETIERTVEFARTLGIKGHFSLATPYPGTVFWKWVSNHGTFLNIPYSDFEQTPVFETPEFSREERMRMWEWASAACTG